MTPASPPSLFGPLMAFVLVLACVPLALWLLKRSPWGARFGAAAGAAGAGRHGAMQVISQLAIGPNQRVLTVEVGTGEQRQWLVLGVSPAGIQTLHVLPAGGAAGVAAAPGPVAPVAAPAPLPPLGAEPDFLDTPLPTVGQPTAPAASRRLQRDPLHQQARSAAQPPANAFAATLAQARALLPGGDKRVEPVSDWPATLPSPSLDALGPPQTQPLPSTGAADAR